MAGNSKSIYLNRSYLALVYLIFFLCSCSNKVAVTRVVRGWWTIDRGVMFNGIDITDCLMGNSIFFKRDNCEFPRMRIHCSDLGSTLGNKGEWEIKGQRNGGYTLEVTSSSGVFSQVYTIGFVNDAEHKLLKMVLKSEKLTLTCTKALFDYDANQELIEQLEISQ